MRRCKHTPLLLQILGLIAIAIGIFLLATNSPYTFVTGNSIVSGAVLILISGLVTGIIAVVGFVGAAFKWRPLLLVVSYSRPSSFSSSSSYSSSFSTSLPPL